MTSQCLTDRRIGELETLQTEIAAWSQRVNDTQRAVDWQWVYLRSIRASDAVFLEGWQL